MKFYSKNRITLENSTISEGILSRLLDRIPTIWESETTDTIIVLESQFDIEENYNRIILLSHNFSNLSFQYYENNQWFTIGNWAWTEKQEISICSFDTHNKTHIRMQFGTAVDSELRYCRDLILCEEYFSLSRSEYPNEIRDRSREQSGRLRLLDGSEKFWKLEYSEKKGFILRFRYKKEDFLRKMRDFKLDRTRHPFFFQPGAPYPDSEIYLMNWVNPLDDLHEEAWLRGEKLHSFTMEMHEV
jgi:hypothetical protein